MRNWEINAIETSLRFEDILLNLISKKPNLKINLSKGTNYNIYLYYSISNYYDSKDIYFKLDINWDNNRELFKIDSAYFYIIDRFTGCKELSGYFISEFVRRITKVPYITDNNMNIYISEGNIHTNVSIVGVNHISTINMFLVSNTIN